MKQALLIVNALLVIAVSYLLFKQFDGRPSTKGVFNARVDKKNDDSLVAGKKALVAYINMDSIQNGYVLAKEVSKEVDRKRASLTNEINKMESAYKNKVDAYQKKGPSMTEEEVNSARQDLENSFRQMNDRKQSLDDEFGQWLQSKKLGVIKDIQDYLKKFNADGAYSFIFSYEAFFYYSDPAYDITSQVLKGLNDEYKAKKK